MGDLQNPTLIWIKGFLFVVLGLISAVLIIALTPQIRIAALLCICIWAFCRAYYFAFYVIEHYVDSQYRFAGLWDFVKFAVSGNRK
jgi:hypothetical protein